MGRKRSGFGHAPTRRGSEPKSERAAVVVLVRKRSEILPIRRHLRRGLATRGATTHTKRTMNFAYRVMAAGAVATLAGCVTVPTGPTYSAMPGTRKSFDQFQIDDASCRQYAVQAIGGTPNQAAADAAVGSAVVGTILGAAVGGLIGGGDGAAIGAGMGLFGGSAVGASNAQYASYTTQQRLDNTYYQCMYSQGHKVPMPASYARSMRQANAGPAPAPYVGAPPRNAAIPPPNAPPPNAAIPPPNAPPPNAAIPPPNTPPPNAAIPPPNAPPPYVQR